MILPALQAGRWVGRIVLPMRPCLSGRRPGLAVERIEQLESWVQRGLQPDLTLLFDVPLEVSRDRLAQSRGAGPF